ncbi:hypothetical protein AURANDRAFT_68142 [Aureococcus anophagefferens]|uniref:C2 domain-containing protein n=1 Tax=Aureococcus anophagefferens TaxID=44056 RepID=F0YNM4_AURAN|nr:hypothetical protein AURANDRAFT_68142 [Aureococcus anophagefferens]EGB03292.1 hypothetical protein AURANDRAFT_68142 [Aureococcus anophagefferens]|eukprot:XP_009042009.1 hypothetical protein AURANDRAFT_68142 [Aureococcus anophagefferens]
MQETKMEAPDAGNWRAGNPLAANPRKPRPRSASPPKPTPSESPRREKWKSSAVGGPEKRFSAELAAQPRLVVRVLGARGLGSSDVVARVWCARLDDVHDADAEPQETLPCRGGDAPAWETHNEFCFALKLDAPEDVQGGCCAVALRDDGVARETGYADGDAALGVAVVPLRMIFERGKAMAGTKTVHLTATWLPLGAAPNGARRARGEVLASFVFFFAEGLSRAAFETSVARILGRPEEYDDDELASPPAAWPPRDAAAPRRRGPPFSDDGAVELRGLGGLSPIREHQEKGGWVPPSPARPLAAGAASQALDTARSRAGKESDIPNFKGSDLGRFPLARSRARSSADFSGASSARYVAMKRLQKAARSAEASLLQAGTPSKISSGHRALRDRLRDGLAALRERDSRHAGAGELWGELKALESPGDASAFFEELLGTRHTARAGGLASAVLADDGAPLAARRHVLLLLAAVARLHPGACVPKLGAALRAVAGVAQGASGAGSSLSGEAAAVAGALARDVFPLAAARGAPEESTHLPVDVLVAPFTLVLARPRARGRRSVANCFAAVLEGRPGPVPVWLDAAPASKHVGAAPPAAVLDDLRRRAASRGVALPVAATLLRDGTGAVLHCENDDAALDLRATLAQDEALPPGWALDGAMEAGEERGTVEEAMAARAAFVLAVAPAAAPLASWVVESCKRHRDVLEPFCRAARALLQLRSDAQALGRADAAANAAFDPRLLARADGAYVEALDAAAPALARHAARCVEAEATTAEALAWRDKAAALDLVEALATNDCTQAAAALVLGPLVGACDRARHHGVKHVRDAAKRALLALEALRARRRDAKHAAARPSRRDVNALLGAKLPVSAVGLPNHDDAASVDYGWPRPATPPSPRRARPGGAPVPALDVSRLAEAPIPRAPPSPDAPWLDAAPSPRPAPTPARARRPPPAALDFDDDFAKPPLDDDDDDDAGPAAAAKPWRRRRSSAKRVRVKRPSVAEVPDDVADALTKSVDLLAERCRGFELCRIQPLVWVVLTKLQNSLARSHRSRFG